MEETALEKRARCIVEVLRNAGHEAYFAGGSVRDRLMGKSPQDIDIATSAVPEEVMTIFPRTFPVGVSFGVILVLMEDQPFEVATFRSDGEYFDNRHPGDVTFSSAEEDVKRRDFTINGMLYDPLEDKVIDYVGGRKDIRDRVIRAIGDPRQRFTEDHLRMLRAIRFASRLGFSIHPDTWEALVDLGPAISSVSAERFRDELLKILTDGDACGAVKRIQKAGMLRVWLPEIEALQNVLQPKQYHPEGDVWNHTFKCLEEMDKMHHQEGESIPETLALAVLLHDTGKKIRTHIGEDGRPRAHGHPAESARIAGVICDRLKTSKHMKKMVVGLVRDHGKPAVAPKMKLSRLKRLLREEHFTELLQLHRIDRLGGSGDLSTWHFLKKAADTYKEEQIKPPPLLRGKDLAAMGYSPGPSYGHALGLLEEAQLNEEIKTRKEAKELIKKILGLPNKQGGLRDKDRP